MKIDDNLSNLGILDVDGSNPNPLTNLPYSDTYKDLAKIWSKYPAYENAKSIIQDIKDYQVLVVISGTGSGKTVLIPKFALHAIEYMGKIAITLPKQVITKSAAEFAAKTLDVKLGNEVGYQFKGSNAKSSKTKLLYATDGTIVQRLLNDPKLLDFDIVVIDEAHERKVQIDFLLYLLKNALNLRPELKVIIMSATINADIFSSYFSEFKFKEINIGGKTNYPIESIFLKESLDYNSALLEGFEILKKLLEKEGDILFFITSQSEAFEYCRKLTRFIEECDKDANCKLKVNTNITCFEVYAKMGSSKQETLQSKISSRKIIFATNVAESSLTIEGILFVIDSGQELKSYYDPNKRARILDRQLITMAQAKQRMGRTGRTSPGTCYHLYTKNDFENMVKFPEPDIRTSDISSECLRLLALDQIGTTENLLNMLTKMIEPPKEIYIRDALTKLMQMGMIEDGKITTLGKLSTIANDPMIGKTLVYSILCNCSREVSIIIGMLDAMNNKMGDLLTIQTEINRVRNIKDTNLRNKKIEEINQDFQKKMKKFKSANGDFISILNIYDKATDIDQSKLLDFCKNNYIKMQTILKAKKNIRKLFGDMSKYKNDEKIKDLGVELGIDIEKILRLDVDDRITYCIVNGFYINRATSISNKTYRVINSNTKADIEKLSFVKKYPKNIIYSEYFISMGNSSLNIISKIPDSIDKLL